ncbi:MAG: cytochrome c oxidase assembly protein [Gammaproteobacteria bacterium]|nr:MAG: cytochrome c oxidase assembly protein [Gammaproteobacteria bacterium]
MDKGQQKSHNKTVGLLAGLTVFMFGFGFALVPLYDVFCEVTGLNGKTADGPAVVTEKRVDKNRTVNVQFIANLNNNAPWKFKPEVFEMKVHPGELKDTRFFAQNLTKENRAAQAVPSVSPGEAASHFNKTECFCFTRQVFKANEGRWMPLRFMVDPDLPDHLTTLTLSYTFFELDKVAMNTD